MGAMLAFQNLFDKHQNKKDIYLPLLHQALRKETKELENMEDLIYLLGEIGDSSTLSELKLFADKCQDNILEAVNEACEEINSRLSK